MDEDDVSVTRDSPARERSRRYPFIPLRKALERAEQIKAQHGKHPIRIDSAVAAWGYGVKSSGGRQTVATLLMYRVMTDFGSGNDRKVQLTDLAWRYLVDQRPDKRQPLLREMVLSPDIMSEMWSEWGATPPGDSECHIQLVLDRGFTESAATDFLAIYKDNVAFAQLVEEQVVNSELPSTPASSEVWPSSAPPTSSVFPASVVASPTVQPTTATDAPGVVWREERLLDDQGEEILIRYKGEPTADRYAFIRDYLDFKLRRMKPSGS